MNKIALVLACVLPLPATAQNAAELDTLVVSATRIERALNDTPSAPKWSAAMSWIAFMPALLKKP